MRGRSAQSGFTLIELMMVVAIIGIISSVAIPSFQNFTLRVKAAERRTAHTTIKNAASQYFSVHDSLPGNVVVGNWNPYPWGTTPGRKLEFRRHDPGWRLLESAMEGSVYYTYYFVMVDAPGRFLLIWSDADLDGDGVRSEKQTWYDGTGGGFQQTGEWPAPALDGTTW